MIKNIATLATVAVLTAVSALGALNTRQQQGLPAFAGEWYVAGMSANLTEIWEDTTSVMGLSCGCPRFNITLHPSNSSLLVDSACDLRNATTSTIVGNVTTLGEMAIDHQLSADEYVLLYSIRNATVSINSLSAIQTMTQEYSTELQTKLVFVPSCANGCGADVLPVGILSWSTSEPMAYKALLSSNSTLNETGYNELANASGSEDAQGLVKLNTTCTVTGV